MPKLDKRLLPAFGALCAADPQLRGMYSVVADIAVRAMLEAKTMKGLFQLADEVDIDVDSCTSKEAVVQTLISCSKSLVPSSATRGMALPGVHGDHIALLEFFITTSGPSWKNNTGWGTSAPLGEWHGVTTNDGGRVAELELLDNNLKGETGEFRAVESAASVRKRATAFKFQGYERLET